MHMYIHIYIYFSYNILSSCNSIHMFGKLLNSDVVSGIHVPPSSVEALPMQGMTAGAEPAVGARIWWFQIGIVMGFFMI